MVDDKCNEKSTTIIFLYFRNIFVVYISMSATQSWVKQFGTSNYENINAMTTGTDGAIYVGGYTTGVLSDTNAGGYDAFLAKYDSDGNQTWVKQFGTTGSDYIYAMTTGTDGAIYVGGSTGGAFSGTNAGGTDAFLAKYNSDGTQAWVRQFGTSNYENINAMTTGTDGAIYVGGYTTGVLSGTNAGVYDAFLAKYDSDGNQTWVKQFGTSGNDYINAMTTGTDGAIYVGGYTGGAFSGTNAGGYDAFLAKYNSDGTQDWVKQFGTSGNDYIYAMTTGTDGAIYVGGYTSGDLSGTNTGKTDAFLAKYNSDGNQVWVKQFGTSDYDYIKAMTTGTDGAIYVGGYTSGAFSGTNTGIYDAFLAKYTIASAAASSICFPAGTPVLTNLGYVHIEQIDPSIHTVRNQPILAITQTISDEKHLICIAKHALGNNYPSKTTVMSQNHQVMFMGQMIKAKDLLGLVDKVTQKPYHGEPLYNVLLETHEKMQVNNLIVETLHPENKVARLYHLLNMVKPEEHDQVIALYNQLERQHKQSLTK